MKISMSGTNNKSQKRIKLIILFQFDKLFLIDLKTNFDQPKTEIRSIKGEKYLLQWVSHLILFFYHMLLTLLSIDEKNKAL